MTSATQTRHVVVVEDHAHEGAGHFPVLFAELADALVGEGCGVTALTLRGWYLLDPQNPPRFRLCQPTGLARSIVRAADRLYRLRPGRISRPLSRWLIDLAMATSALRLAQRADADLIVTNFVPRIGTLSLLPRRTNILKYQFFPHGWESSTRGERLTNWVLPKIDTVRRRRGGSLTIVCCSNEVGKSWVDSGPGFRTEVMPFAGSRTVDPVPDARAQLGLDPSARIALSFGAAHGGKHLATVWEAFARLADRGELREWHLLVAGSQASDFHEWKQEHHLPDDCVTVIPGFVDERTRNLVFAAADLLLVSFTKSWSYDSGSFADAVAWGLPVLCSSPGQTSELVRSHRLGATFAAEDPEALCSALASVPTHVDADALADIRRTHSIGAVARRHLEILDSARPD